MDCKSIIPINNFNSDLYNIALYICDMSERNPIDFILLSYFWFVLYNIYINVAFIIPYFFSFTSGTRWTDR